MIKFEHRKAKPKKIVKVIELFGELSFEEMMTQEIIDTKGKSRAWFLVDVGFL